MRGYYTPTIEEKLAYIQELFQDENWNPFIVHLFEKYQKDDMNKQEFEESINNIYNAIDLRIAQDEFKQSLGNYKRAVANYGNAVEGLRKDNKEFQDVAWEGLQHASKVTGHMGTLADSTNRHIENIDGSLKRFEGLVRGVAAQSTRPIGRFGHCHVAAGLEQSRYPNPQQYPEQQSYLQPHSAPYGSDQAAQKQRPTSSRYVFEDVVRAAQPNITPRDGDTAAGPGQPSYSQPQQYPLQLR